MRPFPSTNPGWRRGKTVQYSKTQHLPAVGIVVLRADLPGALAALHDKVRLPLRLLGLEDRLHDLGDLLDRLGHAVRLAHDARLLELAAHVDLDAVPLLEVSNVRPAPADDADGRVGRAARDVDLRPSAVLDGAEGLPTL